MSLGALAALAGYLLLAPPPFFLVPFLLLGLAARPRSFWETGWLVAAAAGIVLFLAGPRSPTLDLIRTGSLVQGAVFLVLSARSTLGAVARTLLSTALTGAALVVWERVRGLGWSQIHAGFATLLRETYEAMARQAPENRALLQGLIDSAGQVASFFPGVLALQALAGTALAWLWHHRIMTAPLGTAPVRFRDFRFNDHLVWGAIFTLALLVLPGAAGLRLLAGNLLVVAVGLYALRGLAVAVTVFSGAAPPTRVLVAGAALLLLPLTLGACLALGLADTWLDTRGRLASRASGGTVS